MLPDLLTRLLSLPRGSAAPRRLEVCPPALLRARAGAIAGWRSSVLEWLVGGWNQPVAGPSAEWSPDAPRPVPPALTPVRDEFIAALADIRTQQVGHLQHRIRAARSMRDLWHLRPELFKLVALGFSQAEAQSRLDRLNRHFPTRSPRSGFGQFDAMGVNQPPRKTS